MPGLPKRLLMLAISMVYLALSETRRMLALVFHLPSPPLAPVVLTYHGIPVSQRAGFERQMRVLAKGHRTVFADDGAQPSRTRAVAITFDDAFDSVFDNALPVLDRYGIPCTVFVPTGYIGGAPGWMTPSAAGGASTVASRPTLTAIDARRVKLGSHSKTHRHLNALSPEDVDAELLESKATLETITGAPVTMLSLPFGSCSELVLARARGAGYSRVFTNVPVRHGESLRNSLAGRMNVSPRDWRLEFTLKAAGAYDWMGVAVPLRRSLTASASRGLEQL